MNRPQSLSRRDFFGLVAAAGSAAAASDPDYAKVRAQLRDRSLFVVPFSHVDWAWVNSRQWMVRRHAIVISEVLDLLRTNPDFRFYIESWNEQMEPFLARDADRIGELRSAIQQGKVEICGGVCNQHPGWMGQESLIRDMVMGRRLFERFAPGLNLNVIVHNDVTPGSSQMPQILTKAGYRFYRINRPEQGLAAEKVPLNFRWKGLDGTELITLRGPTCGFIGADPLPEDFAQHWQQTVESIYKTEIGPEIPETAEVPVWLPFGCDDSRPMRSWHATKKGGKWDEHLLPMPAFIAEWNQRETSHIQFGTPLDVFRGMEQRWQALPVFEGVIDATMWTYWYGLNGNQGLRVWRARTEQVLTSAERLWTCEATPGESYPAAALEKLWRDLLRVYSHAQMWLFDADYAAQLDRLKATYLESQDLLHSAMRQITARIKANGNRSCVVFLNDLPWDRTETVSVWIELQDPGATNVQARDSRGGSLDFQVEDVNWYDLPGGVRTIRELQMLVRARVPALGYTTVYVDPVPGDLNVPLNREGSGTIDSETISMRFSEHGIDSVTDKHNGANWSNLGNIIYNRIRDTGPMHYGPVEETFRITEVKVERLVQGPLRSYFLFSGKVGPHAVAISGHIDPKTRTVSFDSTIQSAGGSGHFMTIAGLPGPGKLSADVQFGVEDRDVSKIPYGALERRRENVFYGANWADFTDGSHGLTLVATTGEKGFEYLPARNQLGHFLLMTNPPATAEKGSGPPEPWERFVTRAREGTGTQVFDYHFLLHDAGWREGDVVRRVSEIRSPIHVMQLEEQRPPAARDLAEEKSFLNVSGKAMQTSAVYRDSGALILRLYESAGAGGEAQIDARRPIKSVQEIDFNGRPIARSISRSGSSLRLDLKPWEIITLRLS